MKRMEENAISYYTIKKEDMKNITPEGAGIYTYTASTKFIEVLHDFKCALRVDWTEIAPSIAPIIGSHFSILYPVNKVPISDEGDIAYAYYGGSSNNKQVNPAFFEINGAYKISWELS